MLLLGPLQQKELYQRAEALGLLRTTALEYIHGYRKTDRLLGLVTGWKSNVMKEEMCKVSYETDHIIGFWRKYTSEQERKMTNNAKGTLSLFIISWNQEHEFKT